MTVWPGLAPLAAMLDHGVRTALGDADREARAWGAALGVTQALAHAVQATEATPTETPTATSAAASAAAA